MADGSFQKTIFINVEPLIVLNELANPRHYIGLQPLLIDISEIQETKNALGEPVVSFLSVELFKFFGFLHIHNPIRTSMTIKRQELLIISEVNSPGNIHLQVIYSFVPEKSGTRLTQDFHITMPLLIQGFVLDQANKAQDAVLENLKARLES